MQQYLLQLLSHLLVPNLYIFLLRNRVLGNLLDEELVHRHGLEVLGNLLDEQLVHRHGLVVVLYPDYISLLRNRVLGNLLEQELGPRHGLRLTQLNLRP